MQQVLVGHSGEKCYKNAGIQNQLQSTNLGF